VSTLQKFPVIVDAMQEMAGKRFAVIIDEAHSSQTGEAAAAVRQVLAEYADLDDAEQKDARDEEPTDEDVILKKLRSRRVETTNVSFFAFTATPKQKTLELFGAKDPTSGKFYPFSLYSMKQAIDERFILDVLKNYTTYETYFALQKRIADDPEFDHAKAQRLLVGFVDRHEHAIDKKVAIIVEHFHDRIARLIGGQAKAMIVTRSRLHAVRFRQALDRYLLAHGYPYQALVAFSGLVRDGAGEYTESRMNGGVPEKSTADEFKKNEYKFLVVAEKFQTGFDQPLLEAMYVDKKLSGVNAVQTLSRLNRTHADKDDAYVVDFVNTAEEISDAFEPYYTTTILSRATDPNILHDLERDLYAYKLFTVHEVQGFADEYFKNAPAAKLNSFLDEVVRRYVVLRSDEQDEVRSKLNDYIRKYAFVSQIVSFEDAALERLYVFAKLLRRKLPIPKNPLPYDVLEAVDMESYKVQKREDVRIQLGGVVKELEPMGTGGDAGQVNDEKDPLSAIIQEMNERFGTSFNLEDRVILNTLSKKLAISDPLKAAIRNNSRDAAKLKFDEIFQKELVGMLNNHFDLYQKLDQNPELKEFVNTKLFDYIQSNLKNANE
jgi:type I restriction enzyme R subunit